MFDWLLDYQKMTEEIEYMEFKLEREKRELRRYTSGDLMNVKLAPDSIASGLEERIAIYEYELAHKMNDQHDAKRLIASFKGLDNQILYGKYVEGKTLGEVALDLGYTSGHVYNQHAQIMKIIDFAHILGQL